MPIHPETLPCYSNSNIEPYPEWDSETYALNNDDQWSDSLTRCYDRQPKDNQLQTYKFVFTQDTSEQFNVKTEAAKVALEYVMEKFDANYKNDHNYQNYRILFYARMYHFFGCLRTFHPLTMHMKTKGYSTTYTKAAIYNCPLGKGACTWRHYHKIDYFNPRTEDHIESTCLCCKPQQLGSLRYHVQMQHDSFNLHKSVYVYLSECKKN